jgi:hypothetical protein
MNRNGHYVGNFFFADGGVGEGIAHGTSVVQTSSREFSSSSTELYREGEILICLF